MALAAEENSSGYANVRQGIRGLMGQGHFKQALAHLVQMPSIEAEWLDDAATCYWRLGDTQTAIKLTEMVVQDLPKNELGWGKLGAMCLSTGDTERAREAFQQLLRINPKSVPTLASLNRLEPFGRSSQKTRTLRKLANAKTTRLKDRANAWNALGRIEEAAGNYDQAFRHFARCKSMTAGVHERTLFDRHLEGQIAQYDGKRPSLIARAGQPRVIFIVGLPRSGTTLAESILCQHSQVSSVGESPALMQSLEGLRANVRKSHGEASDWAWYKLAGEDALEAARKRYFSGVSEAIAQEPTPVIVDKLPFNCLEMGYARLILPDARFVFMSRHPLDVGLSNFATHFAEVQPFTHRLEDIAHLTRVVYASLDHYAPLLGAFLRRQSYQSLVEAPGAEIRALVAHAGLDWEDACLAPETREGAVRTASVSQVRAPINTGALAKWQRYEAALEPLIEALGGWDWIKDWETADAAGGESNRA